MKQIYNYGEAIQGAYVLPHPNKRHEFLAEMRPAKVAGFSHPNHACRDWGWRGSVLVEFEDGKKSWQPL